VEIGRQQLDQGFFPSRWERASKADLPASYGGGRRRGIQYFGAGPARPEEAELHDDDQVSLIKKGIIYTPTLSRAAFTVPGMAAYIFGSMNPEQQHN